MVRREFFFVERAVCLFFDFGDDEERDDAPDLLDVP